MNNFSTVYDFLLHNQKLHARIAEFYRALQLETSDERVNMLLTILVKHELALLNSMRNYIEQANNNILDTYVQFDREKSVENLFSVDFDRSDISTDNVEHLAHRFDQYFSELYDGMSTATENEQVTELFDNLCQYISEEKKRVSKDLNSVQDM
ncbi:hypothetical protein [Flavobacterium sp. W21_SRS_FM6]|uniref:hypothetical protein n=1 Tax=Flavobacterium sp. W21_SRS_FM6 TaxID=3240268 RepID=UPI003F923D9D